MSYKYQSTGLNRNLGEALRRLDSWADNPWRKYSLLLIVFLSAFLLGSSIGMLSGVLALMDPVGAFFTVLFIELLVRIRGSFPKKQKAFNPLQVVDMARIGFLYGLFMEGFKLL